MSQTITGTISSGVTLTAQSTTIASTALITTGPGVDQAIYGTLSASTGLTLTNFGTIIGSNFETVVFQDSHGDDAVAGTIVNESGGLIDGSAGYGILDYGLTDVVNDAGGTITGSTYAIGIEGDPSTVTNAGLIQSSNDAILEIGESSTATLSVVNLAGGRITGSIYGVYLEAAQNELVVNQAGGTISGAVVLDSGGTVTNAGAIIGVSGGDAVSFDTSSAPVRLIVDPGAVFSGDVTANAANSSNTIELAKGSGAVGTLDGFGSTITNFNTLVFDTGAEWTISSNQAGLNNAALTGFVRGDTIDLSNVPTGDVTINYVANNGTVTIAGGGSFTIAGTFPDLIAQSDGAGGTSIVVAPTVTSDTASPATGDYTIGQAIRFTLATSEPVTVTGTPTLTLNDGGTATYNAAASTSTSLVFSTTVAAGQNAATLAVTGVTLPPGAAIQDDAGNNAVLTGADASFTGLQVDTTAPTVTSDTASPATGDYTTGQAISFTLATSEAVTVTGSPVLTLNDGGTASYNAAASTSTSLVFSTTVAAGQNVATLAVTGVTLPTGATIQDGAGNNAVLTGADASFTGLQVDTTAPTVTSDTASPATGDYTTGQAISFTLATSEAVTVTGTPTLTLNDGGTASYNAAASTSTSLVFSTTVAAGQNAATLAVTGVTLPTGATIQDGAGNNAVLTGADTSFTGLQVDTTAPTVTSDTANPATGDYTTGQAISFTLATSEPVTVTGSPVLTLNDGGTASYNAAASTSTSLVFSTTVAAGQNAATLAVTGVTLPTGATIQDGAGNNAVLTGADASFTGLQVDTTAPTVTSDTASPATGDETTGQAISFTLATSEPVTVNGAPTLTLNDGGTASYNAAASTSTSLVFSTTVAAGQNAATLAVTGVTLPTGATIQDGAGNNAVLTGADTSFTGLQVDTTAPTVTSDTASPATGDYTTGQAISFTLATSEAVTVTGSPVLTLNDGGTASYNAAASTSTSLVFSTTVAAGQNAATLAVTGVTLPTGAAIQDGAGNNAVLTGADASFTGLQVDTTAPTITSDTANPATGDETTGQAISFTLATSEPVTVNGTPTLTLNDGGTASYNAAASTSTSLVFSTTVAAGQNAATLAVTGVTLPTGATIQDGAGNNAVLTGADASFTGLQVDTTAPTITSDTANPATGDETTGQAISFTLATSEPVTVNGAPVLTLNDGGTASYNAAASTSTSLVFSTTVAAGQNAATLAVTGVTLPTGATIQDGAGNNAVLTGADASFTGLQVDTTAPTVTSNTASPATGDYTTGQAISFTLATSEPVTVNGAPTLTLNDGGTASYNAAASTSTSLVFSTTVAAGQNAATLAVTGVTLPTGATIQDGAGNNAVLTGADTSFTGLQVDTTAPTVTSNTANPATGDETTGQAISFTLATSEAVTVNGAPTLTLNDGGTASYDAAASTSTSLVFSTTVAAGQNAATLAVTGVTLPTGATIQDGAGNNAVLTGADTSFTGLQVDTTAPTVTSNTANPATGDETTGQAISFTLATSEAVTVTGTPTLTLNDGGTASYNAAASTSISLVFSTTVAAGQNAATLAVTGVTLPTGATIQDGAGNNAVLTGADASFTGLQVDTTAPTITSDTANPATGDETTGQAISFTLATSEPVTVNGAPTLTLNDGGTASYNAAASTSTSLVFSTTVAAGQNAATLAVTGVTLPTGATIQDGAGNNAVLTGADASFTGLQVDTTAPTITSDTANPATGDYTTGQAISFTLATSEAVTVTGSPVLTLNDGGTASYNAAASTSTALVFSTTVAAGQNAATLAVTGVTLPPGATIQDGAGNNAVLTGADTSFTGLQVDTTAPTITSDTASPATGDETTGQAISFTLATSEPVTVNGAPTLTLNDGGTASYNAAASTSTSLVFSTTVAAGQNAATLAVTGVTLPTGATIQDGAGNNAVLTGADASFTGLQVDTTAPTVTSDTASPATGDYTTGQAISFTLATSEPVTVTGAPTLTLNDGGTASYNAAASTSTSLVFSTTVAAGQNAATLAVTGVTLPTGATIQDGAGNNAVLTGADASFTGLQVDTTAPTITSDTASPSTGDYTTGQAISFTLATSEAVTVTGTPTLTLNDGGTASYNAAASTSTSLVFSTTVAAGQNAATLAVTGVTLPPGAAIQDGAGNNAVLTGADASFTGLQVDTTAPVVASPTVTVGGNSLATAIGITAPTDAGFSTSQLTITAGALPSDGTVTLANGTAVAAGQALTSAQLIGLLFTPATGQFGQNSAFTYSVTDPAGNASNGTATLAIGPAVGNPTVSSPSLTVSENAAAAAIGIAAPTDPNYSASQLTIAAGALPSDGTVTLANGTAVAGGEALTSAQLTSLLFTPAAGQFGASSAFTYSVSDPAGNAATGTAALAIGPAVGRPVTISGALTVAPGQTATALNVPAPTDPNYAAAQLTATVTALPTNGTIDLADGVTPITLNQVLSAAQLGSLSFVAGAGVSSAQSSFGYTVADPSQNTASGSFGLAVGPNVGNPTVSSPTLAVAENAAATAIGIAAPTDPNYSMAQLTVTAGALPSDGTVTLANGTAVAAGQALTSAQLTSLLFTPTAGQFRTSSAFTYSVTDPANNATTGAATLAIGPAAGNPVTTSGALTVAPGQAATTLNVPAPTDPNYAAAQLTATVTALPTNGTIDLADGVTPITLNQVLSAAQLGSLTFVADAGVSSAQSSVGYTVADPAQNTATGSFTVAVGASSAVAAPTVTAGNLITDTTTPTLTGTAMPGSVVTLQLNGTAAGTASANPTTGAFSVAPTNPLPLGADTLTVTASTSAGTSPASAATKLFVLPNPVNGIVTADNSTVDIASLLGQGFQLQFTSGTEALQLLDGTLSMGPDTNEAYLARLYEGVLHLSSSGAGYADDLLAAGTSPAQLATDFLATPAVQAEFAGLDNASFVTAVGQDLLGRTLSASDVNGFTSLLSAGASRGVVLAGIADSAEAKTYLASDTSDVFVARPTAAAVYQMFETGLGREPDLAGAQFATNEVLQGGLSLLQVAQQISLTPEFLADHASQTNSAYINNLYQSGLGRPVDPAGSAQLTAALNNGQITRSDALFAVATSGEASAHLTHPLA